MSDENTIHCILAALGKGLDAPERLLESFSLSVHDTIQAALEEVRQVKGKVVFIVDLPLHPSPGTLRALMEARDLPPTVALARSELARSEASSIFLWADYLLPVFPENRHQEILPHLVHKLHSQCARMHELCSQAEDTDLLKQSIKKREEELSLLTGMSQLFHSCADEQALIEIADMYFPLIFSFAQGAVYLIEDDEDHLKQVYSWGDGICSRNRFSRFTCKALEQNMPHSVRSMNEAELVCRHIHPREDENIAAFCLPLLSDNELLGLMYLQAESEPEPEIASSVRMESLSEKTIIARTVAESIALALSNIRLRRQLREMAIRDQLTGLFNRRYMEETLTREASSSLRNGHQFSLIMFDIDHFKSFNDTYGHEAGDTVLSELGAFLLANSRTEDIPCRYGGEEIMLILVNTSYNHALTRAEDIRKGIAAMQLSYQDKLLPQVTISCGVAEYPLHGHDPDHVVDLADKALYKAKESGRNKVCGQEEDDIL